MKTFPLVIVALVLVFFADGLRAESVQFTETLTDRLVTNPGPIPVVVTGIGGSFNASMVMPGLGALVLTESTRIKLTLGGLTFDDLLGNADASTDNSVTFFQYAENLTTGLPQRVGQITFSRSGNVLTATGSSTDLTGRSIKAIQLAGSSGAKAGTVNFSMSVEGLTVNRVVYYHGTSSVTPRVVGTTGFSLNSVSLTGGADFAKPVVTITAPVANQRWSNAVFTVQGAAIDNVGVVSVTVRLNGVIVGSPVPVSGLWSLNVNLAPGTNILQAVGVDADGNQSPMVATKVIYVLTDLLHLTIDPGGMVVGVANNQRLEIGRSYTATARGSNGFLFAGWLGGLPGTNPILRFAMSSNLTLRASFIPNPFIPRSGAYSGLFFPGEPSAGAGVAAAPTNSGFFTITLNSQGVAGGKLVLGGVTIPIINLRFSLNGSAHLVIVRPGPDLTLNLQLDLAGDSGRVDGTLGDGSFESTMRGYLAIGNPTYKGRYTFLIPGGAVENPEIPAGDGAGAWTVDARGLATLAANLGDGTAISQGSSVSRSGDLPVFASLQGGRGMVIGWAAFTTNPLPFDVEATHLKWVKAPFVSGTDKYYRAGFNQVSTLTGARYIAPTNGMSAVGWSNGVVLLDGGNLQLSISNQVTIANNKVTVLSNSNQVALTVTAATGLVGGGFKHPSQALRPIVKGAVIQLPQAYGGSIIGGWFLGTNQSGYLNLKSE